MYKIVLIFVIFWQTTSAKDFTKPPSIALRNEISYVSDVTLQTITSKSPDTAVLTFSLIEDLHNQSDKVINIKVDKKLSKNLELQQRYLIAYQKLRKTKVQGVKKYLNNNDGPFLINVEGASPAIFRYDDLLRQQLSQSPQRIKSQPQQLLNDIFAGMSRKDPKIQTFFVRELINWGALFEHLQASHYQQLLEVYLSHETTVASILAVLENRPPLHKALNVKRLSPKAIDILNITPVMLDLGSEVPSLILQAMIFVDTNNIAQWDTLVRWTQSNAPAIAEKSLLVLKKLDAQKTFELAQQRQKQTLLSDTTRRVLQRYISQNSSHNNQTKKP